MASRFQKLMFNLSTLSPMALIFAIVYWAENDISLFSKQQSKFQLEPIAMVLGIIILLSVLFSFYSILFVKLCHKKLERIPINIDNIVHNDNGVIVVLITYALPATTIIFKDAHNLHISIIIILFWLVFLALSNTILPNPILMFQSYHFYKITTIDGSSEICLLSTRKSINNRNTVSVVMLAFNYLAIEEKNLNVS